LNERNFTDNTLILKMKVGLIIIPVKSRVLGITVSQLHVISKKMFVENDPEFHGTAEEVIGLLVMPSLRKF